MTSIADAKVLFPLLVQGHAAYEVAKGWWDQQRRMARANTRAMLTSQPTTAHNDVENRCCLISRWKQTRYKEATHRYDVRIGILSTPPASLKIMVVTMECSNRKKSRSATHAPMSYELLISSIAEVHARTQTGAAGAVNRYLTLRNWFIGAYIVEFEQNGEDRASYGQQLLPRLAETSSGQKFRVAARKCSVGCGSFTALTPN